MTQEFERYPTLASWVERLGNTEMNLPLGDWTDFVGTLNGAILQAERRAATASPAIASSDRLADQS